jgi:DNA-binding NarL/FixJ family response regulator
LAGDCRADVSLAPLTEMAARGKAKPIRVLIADDHTLFREGLRALLELENDVKVVGEVERADAIKPALAKNACDALLLDLKMDRSVVDDIESLAQLTNVIVLTGSDRTEDMVNAFRHGARAIVQKVYAADTLLRAIRAVADGLVWMPPELQKELTALPPTAPHEQLTAREREIVRYIAVGFKNAEVGKRLAIAEGTVKAHLNNIFQKLDVRDRVELTLYALRTGIIAISDQSR